MKLAQTQLESEAGVPLNFSLEDAEKYAKELRNYIDSPNNGEYELSHDRLTLVELKGLMNELLEWENYIKIIKIVKENEQRSNARE